MQESGWASRSEPTEWVRIDTLLPADSPRTNGEDTAYVRKLSDLDVVLPPIVVHRATMRVIDGMHRIRAARLRGADQVEVKFYDGTAQDAFVLAVELNGVRGMPLSFSDRSAAANRIVGTHPQWSDRRIAKVTGLAPNTIGAIRRRSTAQDAQSNVRVGQDGRTRPRDIAPARQRAGELMAEQPNASLRHIARVAGVSIATAQDVRKRLQRGESVMPPGQQGRPEQRRPAGATEHGRGAKRDYFGVLQVLMKDPSLRLTEGGRLLLRVLGACAIDSVWWTQAVENVPEYHRATVVDLVRECVAQLSGFADVLAQERESNSSKTHQMT